jgi:hypothetical protein
MELGEGSRENESADKVSSRRTGVVEWRVDVVGMGIFVVESRLGGLLSAAVE